MAKDIMNTAVNIVFKSAHSEKTYTLKIFAKGKIVIAGITCPYEQSEANSHVNMFLKALASFK